MQFNSIKTSELILIRPSLDKYYNLSLTITEGGNWSITATPITVFPIVATAIGNFSHELRGNVYYSYERRIMVRDLVTIPQPSWIFYSSGTILGLYPKISLSGTYEPYPLYMTAGPGVDYENGTFESLTAGVGSITVATQLIIINVTANQIAEDNFFTPSETVKVLLSVNVTRNVEVLTPGSKKHFSFNTTAGPTHEVVKISVPMSMICLINVTPTRYKESGILNVTILPHDYEDWWMPIRFLKGELNRSAINESVQLMLISVIPNATYYLYMLVGGDTSEVEVKVVPYEPMNYTLGETLSISVRSLKELAEKSPEDLQKQEYRFMVCENYTYVVKITTECNFTGALLIFVDDEGKIPFKYQVWTPEYSIGSLYYLMILAGAASVPYEEIFMSISPLLQFNYMPFYYVPAYLSEVTFTFTARKNGTVYLYIDGASGLMNITITEIKSYEAGYSEGNETGYQTGYESGYKSGYEGGSSTGQIMGVAIGAPVGLVIGVAVVYLIMRRRIAT